MKDSGREELFDKKFDCNVEHEKFINILFIRLVSKKVRFSNVDFRYCIFDGAYLRKCTFDSCNFTGCCFMNSNIQGSSFIGCEFNYATFEKTFIDSDILNSGCPGHENLKLKFARSLRLNYQQIGDTKSANQAINIELQATGNHLHKAWKSKESYYRKKYKGFKRFRMFGEWLEFKTLDWIWGNGESTWKLIRFVTVVLILITVSDVLKFGNPNIVSDYLSSLMLSPQLLLGFSKQAQYSSLCLTFIYLIRLILFGFFMSIIIKRFNRR